MSQSFPRDRSAWPAAILCLVLVLAAPAARAVDLAVSGIEVTQAIQEFDVANPGDPNNNSVALIEGNHTAARVYIEVTNSTTAVGGVTAFMSVFVNGSLHANIGPNAPGFIAAPLTPDRDNAGHSLNFNLPIDLAEGDDVDLVVTVDPLNTIAEDDEGNNTSTLNDVAFGCMETPEIVYTPINYTAATETDPTTLGTPDPDRIAAGTGDDFIFGIYPWPDDRSQYHIGPFPPVNWTQNIDSSFTDLLNFLESCRQAIDPVPKYLYGWFRENPYNGNGRAIGIPGNVAFGNTQISPNRGQRTFAHELGHLIGFFHNSLFLNPETGWDVENLVELGFVKPTSLRDIMVPGLLTPQAWIHTSTYESVQGNSCFECSGDFGDLVALPFLTGEIFLQGPGRLNPVFEFPRFVEPSPRGVPGPFQIRALNSQGQVIETVGLTPNFESEEGEEVTSAAFSVTLPSLIDLQEIQLIDRGKVTATISRSANAPQLEIVSPRQGQTLSGPVEEVVWEAFDADLDPLTFIVQYSPGFDELGRQLWVPLGVDVRENRLSFETRFIAGSPDASIRVVASDGLNSSMAVVGGLFVPGDKEPTAKIVEPESGQQFLEGSLVILQASVFDREDGILKNENVRWTSDRDGFLGTGRTFQTQMLSPGKHRITVSATDSGQSSVTDEIKIYVAPSHLGRLLKAGVLK